MLGPIAAIIPILVIGIFVLTFALMFNPKLRGKFMGLQVKATKYMVDETKEDIKDISTNMAKATKDGVKITTGAIKEGFSGETVFCKHCGSSIDRDSKFCKKCGKEQ